MANRPNRTRKARASCLEPTLVHIICRMNLALAFADSAKCRPTKTALFWGEREYSYSELWSLTRSVADHLQNQFHVKPGDRVGLWFKNCPEFIPALFGILAFGGVAVPINNFLKTDRKSVV